MEKHTDNSNQDEKDVKKSWIKRLGWGAFAFFLIKGLVWLAIFAGLAKSCG